MKKFLLSLLASFALIANVQAEEFTDYLYVNLYGSDLDPVEATVTVSQQDDGTYTFTLPNFILETAGSSMAIGTINVTGIEGTESDGVIYLSVEKDITIESGTTSGVIFWIGPSLGEIPIKLDAKMAEKLYAYITINMGIMGTIYVTFGEDFTDTGIESVRSDVNVQSGTSYTITGIKASEGYKGIVIKDGKKVLVK